jgi:hypothetical protein
VNVNVIDGKAGAGVGNTLGGAGADNTLGGAGADNTLGGATCGDGMQCWIITGGRVGYGAAAYGDGAVQTKDASDVWCFDFTTRIWSELM